MKLIKVLAIAVFAAGAISLGACASKEPAPAPVTTGYSGYSK